MLIKEKSHSSVPSALDCSAEATVFLLMKVQVGLNPAQQSSNLDVPIIV